MASSDATQRAVLAGLSCGIGLAAPVVVYAATLPFSSINETVVAGAVPFAVGAVAGVGIYAASLGISEYRAEHDGHLFEPDAVGGAAQFSRTYNEFKTASIPVQQEEAAPRAASPVTLDEQGQSSSLLSGLTGAFQRRHADDGVPTIARAANAMDEADAWAMIDSMLDDDSPVSCDPARSRDVYQVAIDELTNGEKTGSYNRDDIAAAARAVSGSHAAPAGSTAAFVALVANAANNAAYNGASSAAYASAAAAASTGQQGAAQPAPVADPFADEPLVVDEETIAARRAAESSLWGASAQMQVAEAVPYNAKLASMPIISDAKGVDLADLDEPAAITASIDAQNRVDTDSLPDASLEEDIPMADYSGHEDMWAAAMAIMAEVAEPAPAPMPTLAASPVSVAPVYVGRHSSVFPEDTARISRESIERAEAIAAGVMENRRHERVNQILEEEIERLQSSTAKRTGRAYLSVIEGGTASFTPLRAEA